MNRKFQFILIYYDITNNLKVKAYTEEYIYEKKDWDHI